MRYQVILIDPGDHGTPIVRNAALPLARKTAGQLVALGLPAYFTTDRTGFRHAPMRPGAVKSLIKKLSVTQTR